MEGLLRGKRAMVTGAAGGIGLATARLYAQHGARVALLDLDGAAAAAAADTLTGETGARCTGGAIDVSDEVGITTAFTGAVDALGGLDVLCNCAGILVRAPFLEYTAQQWDRVFAVNARGTFLQTQAAARAMLRTGGRIIHFSSCAAKKPDPGEVGYGASKAAIDSLTRTAAFELGCYGITVNAICPGATDTAMIRTTFLTSPKAEREWAEKTVLGRLGTPLDQARVALFLASELAAHITGECLIVSAGELMGQ